MSRNSATAPVVALALAVSGTALLPVTASASPASVVHAGGPLADLQTGISDPTDGARGHVTAIGHGGRSTVVLHLHGLDRSAAGRSFGAHVHTGQCVAGDGAAAGPHYNHDVATGTSPAEISDETEVWLDFTVTRGGTATAVARVPFEIAPGDAGAIVVHRDATDHHTGAAGPRLACLPVLF